MTTPMTNPFEILKLTDQGVPLSELLVDIESRGITTCGRLLDDDDGAMDQQESYMNDDGEELSKDKVMNMDICSRCKQVVGDVKGYEGLIRVTWSVLARQLWPWIEQYRIYADQQ
ncbi:predicted protein [Lichtheimia corymbifera JMRC:FSU:9682]|uniref:Uncharacterized protein n=1 Tax=Lichtheimia corymbifera JMRC:FSU:9682 TaxID=1263082 RepID=A0A068SF36_9FUNG|nr:predicted protein [Lichtheimia corymbifera JMRC:FSU:9682]